jgi:hypothetical protein
MQSVNLSIFLIKNHAIKTYGGSGGIASRILNLGCLTFSETVHCTHQRGGWVGQRDCLDSCDKKILYTCRN